MSSSSGASAVELFAGASLSTTAAVRLAVPLRLAIRSSSRSNSRCEGMHMDETHQPAECSSESSSHTA